jgi:hypothetical protein
MKLRCHCKSIAIEWFEMLVETNLGEREFDAAAILRLGRRNNRAAAADLGRSSTTPKLPRLRIAGLLIGRRCTTMVLRGSMAVPVTVAISRCTAMRITPLFALLTAALALSLFAAPAQAQRARVFVASYGSDSNPCTFGSPCKTFQNAVDVVAAGGEVTAIDSAGFGPLNISKAVTITSPYGVEAGIASMPQGIAVTISAGPSDAVVLSGLTLEGSGADDYGIDFTSGASLEIVNCVIRNYIFGGITVEVTAPTTLLISNSVVSGVTNTNQYGIFLHAASGGSITAALNHVMVDNNYWGIFTYGENGQVELSVADSHVENNLAMGINLFGTGSGASSAILKNVTLNQTPYGVYVEQNSTVWFSNLTQSSAAGFTNTAGVFLNDPSSTAAYSDGTSHLMSGFVGDGGAPLQTWPMQ